MHKFKRILKPAILPMAALLTAILAGGGTGVAINTDAHFEGVILAQKAITVNTATSVNGRLLAQTAVT